MERHDDVKALPAELKLLRERLRAIAKIVSVSSLPRGEKLEILALREAGPKDVSKTEGDAD